MRSISKKMYLLRFLTVLAMLSATGCRRPGVILVGPGTNSFTNQILRKGQTLIWEGIKGGPEFSVYWDEVTPCKDPSLELRSSANLKGIQTVVCIVENPPTEGHEVDYSTGPPGHPPSTQQIKPDVYIPPCGTCNSFISEDNVLQSRVLKPLDEIETENAPPIRYACSDLSSVTLPQLSNKNNETNLVWVSHKLSVVSVVINQTDLPTGASFSCSKPDSCTLTNLPANPPTNLKPIPYTLNVNGCPNPSYNGQLLYTAPMNP